MRSSLGTLPLIRRGLPVCLGIDDEGAVLVRSPQLDGFGAGDLAGDRLLVCRFFDLPGGDVATGVAVAEPCRVVGPCRLEGLHQRGEKVRPLTEIRQVLGRMATGLGHEVAEATHELETHRLERQRLGVFEFQAQAGVQVGATVLEGEEPGLVVDACHPVAELVEEHPAVLSEETRPFPAREWQRPTTLIPDRAVRHVRMAMGLEYCSTRASGTARSCPL